ncbi:MAG: twin-arginine translocase subunit TatC [Bacillati bacterium ANGP1]|uniref:Sec-independent protein translocase protein TatC n=1 Tax=Candidatus Segetimicrobium genomatis TaxID=2569760 RepID=A0A537LJK7_9BACT|nr:MAG: twin-arginine translocase subunit TatC [Terrabacteria group bacterium ANGP1]
MANRDRHMTLVEHLEELRQRLQYAVLGLLVATGVGLLYVDVLLRILLRPAGDVKLTTLTVLEPFLVKVKVAFLFGFAVSMPWIMYQIYAFVDPALTDTERRRTIPLALLAGLLFACGLVFGYLLILPVSVHWLLSQAGAQFNVLITANAYISFVLFFLLIIGATFETPLVILTLAFLGVVSPQTLRREWRIAYMVIAAIAVFGTPDWSPVTMLLVAIPMALLYEFSLVLCRIFIRPPSPQPVRES